MLNPIENLEKRIRNLNKKHLSIGAFSALSLGALTIHPALLSSLMLMPFVVGGLVDYVNFKKDNKNSFSGIFENKYHQLITNWLEEYVTDSKNLTEKKYKLIFASLYLQSKGIYLNHYYNLDHFLIKVNEQLVNKNEIAFEIINLFNPISTVSINRFVENDNIVKKDIAQKVAKDFEQVGLLGDHIFSFLTSEQSMFLLKFQDYKLTAQDKAVLRKKIDNFFKKGKTTMGFTGLLTSDIDEIITPIIMNENDKNSLILYKKFFPIFFNSQKDKDYIHENIDKKMNYFTLDEKLTIKNSVKSHKSTNKI